MTRVHPFSVQSWNFNFIILLNVEEGFIASCDHFNSLFRQRTSKCDLRSWCAHCTCTLVLLTVRHVIWIRSRHLKSLSKHNSYITCVSKYQIYLHFISKHRPLPRYYVIRFLVRLTFAGDIFTLKNQDSIMNTHNSFGKNIFLHNKQIILYNFLIRIYFSYRKFFFIIYRKKKFIYRRCRFSLL